MGFTSVHGDHNPSTVFFVYQILSINTIPETGKHFKAGELYEHLASSSGWRENLLEKARIRFF